MYVCEEMKANVSNINVTGNNDNLIISIMK